MARFDYLNNKPKNKPKWYDQPKPQPQAPPPTHFTFYPEWNKPVSQKSGAGGFRFADPNAPKIISQGQPMPVTFLNQTRQADTGNGNPPWTNPLPEQHNRPAYFNNRSTPANFNRWLDSFEQPEKAIEVIEKDYQQYKADMDVITARNENRYAYEPPTSFSDWMGATPFSDAFGEMFGIGWEDPGTDLETVYGRRYSKELAEKNYAYPPDNTNKFLTDYRGMDQARENGGKAYQLNYALNQASPFFQPITDEFGNVLAPLLLPLKNMRMV